MFLCLIATRVCANRVVDVDVASMYIVIKNRITEYMSSMRVRQQEARSFSYRLPSSSRAWRRRLRECVMCDYCVSGCLCVCVYESECACSTQAR